MLHTKISPSLWPLLVFHGDIEQVLNLYRTPWFSSDLQNMTHSKQLRLLPCNWDIFSKLALRYEWEIYSDNTDSILCPDFSWVKFLYIVFRSWPLNSWECPPWLQLASSVFFPNKSQPDIIIIWAMLRLQFLLSKSAPFPASIGLRFPL